MVPGCCDANPVACAPEDFGPVCAGGTACGEEDRVAVTDTGQSSCIVCVAQMLLGRCLDKGVAEQERVQGVGKQGMVRQGLVTFHEGSGYCRDG